jgi:hypothetical protein
MSGDAQDVYGPGLDLHNEQDIHTLQQHSVDMQEVTCQDAGCLSGQELHPRRRRSPWRGTRARRRPGSGGSSPPPRGTPGRAAPPGYAGSPSVGSAAPAAPLGRDRWPARRVRVDPFLLDQAPVPRQQRSRSHDPVQAEVSGQQPRQGRQHGTVSPVRLRAGHLPAQDCNLMPEHEDLRVLSGVTPRQEHQPAGHPDHEDVYEANEHERRA